MLPGWESFVGAGPMPMRHGMTLGELGHWFVDHFKLDVAYRVIAMEGYDPDAAPGFGWPAERIWINPSPNAANLNMARAYAGTVMLEGTTLSEGRGTTRPLELFGAPDIDARAVIAEMRAARAASGWRAARCARSASSRPSTSMSTSCAAACIIHAEGAAYDHAAFRPWRLQALAFKAIRALHPDYPLWRDFPYEYEFGKLAIDVINGGPGLARMGRRRGGGARPISTRWPSPTRPRGTKPARRICSTDDARRTDLRDRGCRGSPRYARRRRCRSAARR